MVYKLSTGNSGDSQRQKAGLYPPGAAVRFKSITKAYEILSDPVKRDEYNQSVNHRIILDAEAEAFELWRSLFSVNGVTLAA